MVENTQKEFLPGTEDLNKDVVEISWDESIKSTGGKVLKFEEDEPTKIKITNWKNFLKQHQKFENGKKIEGEFEEKATFGTDVIEVNGEKVDQVLETTSIRFKTKLKKFLEDKDPKTEVTLNVIRTGEGTGTNYVVQLL